MNQEIIDGFTELLDLYGVSYTYSKDSTARVGLTQDSEDFAGYGKRANHTATRQTVISFLATSWPTLPKTGDSLTYDGRVCNILDVASTPSSPIIDVTVKIN